MGLILRFLVFLFSIEVILAKIGNPYLALGISKDASAKEIKRAYKNLAKEWHPDKNPTDEAAAKFIDITNAYKLLSDAERKKLYDRTGQTEEQPASGFRASQFDHFDDLFSAFNSGGSFRFSNREDYLSYFMKSAINKWSYENHVIPGSKKQPYVLMFFSDWCIACIQVEPIWKRLTEELEPINFVMNTVHAGREVELSRKLGVKTFPYFILVLDGHPYHYTQPSLSMASFLEFIKSKIPHNLVQRVNDDSTLKEFLNGWRDNKVRVLFFGRLDIIRLRYSTVAWEFRERVAVGYVQMGQADTDAIRERYGISSKVDTLLVFQEDSSNPVASVSMADLPYQTMKDIIEANQFLMLPRLSSQTVFDALCPAESSRNRRRLCVVLVTRDSEEHDSNRASLRDYSAAFGDKDKLRYAYLYREKQANFVSSLTSGVGNPEASDLYIVVIWRRDRKHLSYEWVSEKWQASEETLNKSKKALKETLRKLLHTSEPMPFETEIQDLFDEHALSLIWRILNRLTLFYDILREKISVDDFVPAVSVMATLLFIVVGGYVMSYLVKLEEERINASAKADGTCNSDPPKPQLKIHELRGETYNGLIRLLKPGCRTIVLLCDTETKAKLMPKYHKAAWPYRKNKTLMFAFLNTERLSAREWYKRILSLGLLEPRELNINPKNAIGTVLALNGHRKYFCIYHAKHPENYRGLGDMSNFHSETSDVRRVRKKSASEEGLLGASDSESSASEHDVEGGPKEKESLATNKPLLNYYSDILFEEQLLDGFNNWLDRLFEGSTFRYHINYWPDWPGK